MSRILMVSFLMLPLLHVGVAQAQIVLLGPCCLPDGCQDNHTANSCQAAGGVYMGDNNVCSGVTCPTCQASCGGPGTGGCWCDDLCFGFGDCCFDVCHHCAPNFPAECAGNFCDDAQPAGDGTTGLVSMDFATGSGVADSCSTADPDHWFAYTASCTGTATATICITEDIFPVSDVALSVFDSCGGNELACGNSHPSAACLDEFSALVSWLVLAGQTYPVRLSGVPLYPDANISVTFECTPGIPGACCDCDSAGQICEVTTEAECAASGRQFHGGEQCEPPVFYGFGSGPLNLAIPNNDAAGVSHTMNLDGQIPSGRIEDLNVGLSIEHPVVGDLCVTLKHNDGPEVELIRRPGLDDAVDTCGPGSCCGCFAANYDSIILDDEGSGPAIEDLCSDDVSSPPGYAPNNPLSFFDGQDATGEWTLTVRDGDILSFGGLVSWSLIFTFRGANVCVESETCPACGANAETCCFANGSAGCNDADCCACICACDPFCCETEWDGLCAGAGFSDGCGASNPDGPCAAACSVCLPSAGNTCEDAEPVADGLAEGGNNHTASGVASSCSGAEAKDRWYAYTASCTGTATASTCGEFTSGNVAISVFDACPSAGGQEIACNDDYPNCTGGDANPDDNATVSWLVEAGQTYLVRVSATSQFDTAFFNPVLFECAPELGACCYTSHCAQLQAGDCAATAGEFLGPLTSCSDCVLCDLWDNLFGGLAGGPDVRALTTYASGTVDLVAGGTFQFVTATGQPVNNIARWDGSAWHALGSGINGTVYALAEYNGDLIAGGQFQSAGGQFVNNIARWNGSFWQPLGAGLDAPVRALTVDNGELIAGGSFLFSPGTGLVNHIARWNGASWQPFDVNGNIGVSANVLALTVYEGDLIAGGQFEFAGGQPVNHIARWDGAAWQPLGGGMTGSTPTVWALAVYDGDLIAGGLSLFVDPQQNATHIARWDSQQWSALGGGVGGSVFTLEVFSPLGGNLIAGGSFATAAGQTANRIAQWDGSAWEPFDVNGNIGMDSFVYALEVYNQDLIAGGAFTTAGGQPANRIARWMACAPDAEGADGTIVVGEGIFGLWQLDVDYSASQIVSGPLSFGLDELPQTVEATFLLDMGSPCCPAPAGTLDMNVVNFSLTFGDATWTQDDLESFSVQLDAVAPNSVVILDLQYHSGPIDTPSALNNVIINFPLTVSGTDIAGGQPFEYQYAESATTLTPVTCLDVGCCQGACGGQSLFGCWCDEACAELGDCCSDACANCSDLNACPACPADFDGDDIVGPVDLAILLGAWGPCTGCAPDLDGDGIVGSVDLAQMLGAWGPCPQQD